MDDGRSENAEAEPPSSTRDRCHRGDDVRYAVLESSFR